MYNLKFGLAIIYLFFPLVGWSTGEDSTNATVKLSLRYVLETKTTKTTSRTIKDGETGNIPVTMNLQLDVQPFLWVKSPVKNLFIVSDSKFGQDRTSSEFGVGFRKENIEIYLSYGFRVIRTDDKGATKGLSSNFDNAPTKSIGVSFKKDILGIETVVSGSASYDGGGEWFYRAQAELFPFSDVSPIHLLFFHESYFGSGAYLVYRGRNGSTDIFSGYLLPESRSEYLYKRSEGVVFGLTHTWR